MNATPALEATVLIVEDDEGHALLIRENLRETGISFKFKHLRDGQDALDYLLRRATNTPTAGTGEPYLMLLDIRMPRIDGIEVLRRLKLDSVLKKLPVVMVSTGDNPGEVARCYELGCSAYVQKPVDYDQFAATIRQLGTFAGSWLIPSV